MRKIKFVIAFVLLAIIGKFSFGQTNTSNDSLICKEWKLTFYEEKGKKYPPTKEQMNDRMIFYFNHKVKSIETGNIQNGVWKYDDSKKTLTVIDNQTKDKVVMKVISITDKEFIIEYTDPNGVILRIYMTPVKKKK